MTRTRDVATQGGLVLLSSTTIGSGVSSVNITNCFSSTYENYRILIRANSASSPATLLACFGTGSAVTTNYASGLATWLSFYTSGASVTVTSTSGAIISFTHPTNITGVCDVFGPNLAVKTTAHGTYGTDTNGGTTASIQTDNTQFTSLHIIPTSGTITGGTISIYGYKK